MKIFVIFWLLFAVTGSLYAKSHKEQVTEIEKSYLIHKLGLDQKKGLETSYEFSKSQLSSLQVKEDKNLSFGYLKKKLLTFSKYKNAFANKVKGWLGGSSTKKIGHSKECRNASCAFF